MSMQKRPTPRLTAKRRRKQLMRLCLPYYPIKVHIKADAAVDALRALGEGMHGLAQAVKELNSTTE